MIGIRHNSKRDFLSNPNKSEAWINDIKEVNRKDILGKKEKKTEKKLRRFSRNTKFCLF